MLINNSGKCIIIYVDDLVIFAETATHLPVIINILHEWFTEWKITMNNIKTNIVHNRNPSLQRTEYVFHF